MPQFRGNESSLLANVYSESNMWLLIYLPAVLLLIAALFLPQMGRDLVGRMNGHEFALFLAFWWMVLATVGRLVMGAVNHARRRQTPRGFEPIVQSSDESVSKDR